MSDRTPGPASSDAVTENLRDGDEATLPAASGGPSVTLGGFRLLEVIGQGGMGIVYRAEDARLRRQVAVKVMKPQCAADKDLRERFLREARAQAAIDHDHVAPVYAADEEKGVPFLVMPLLRGQSLASRLARGRIPLAEAVRIGKEAALGVAAAHRRGLIHRDIKPSNIWLEDSGRTRLMDFGLAREVVSDSEVTQSGAMIGTPLYMAPEQTRGEPVNERADLFSLGCVLYELASGSRPFAAGNVQFVLDSVRTGEPPKLRSLDSAIPAALEAVVNQLLEKDPSRRPASAEATAKALQSLQETLAPKHGGLRRAKPTAIVVGVLALVVLVALALWRPWGEKTSADQSETAPRTPDSSTPATTNTSTLPPLDEAWSQAVAAMSRPEQIDALKKELIRRNPGYDGNLVDEYWNDMQNVKLMIPSQQIVDLTPVRAIPGLAALECAGDYDRHGRLESLEPLRGLSLYHLAVSFNPIRDLSPLQGMPLKSLWATGIEAADLTPVYSLPLRILHLDSHNKQARLDAERLLKKPLTDVWFNPKQVSHFERLREVASLKDINGQPAAEFWKGYGARR